MSVNGWEDVILKVMSSKDEVTDTRRPHVDVTISCPMHIDCLTITANPRHSFGLCLEFITIFPCFARHLVLAQHLSIQSRVRHLSFELLTALDRSYSFRRSRKKEVALLWHAFSVSLSRAGGREPTSRRMIPETKLIRVGTSKIISAVVPDCFTFPSILNSSPTFVPSVIRDLGMNGLLAPISMTGEETTRTDPMGQNVSYPFAVDHGRPFALAASWTLRAVMSTARAKIGDPFSSSRPQDIGRGVDEP